LLFQGVDCGDEGLGVGVGEGIVDIVLVIDMLVDQVGTGVRVMNKGQDLLRSASGR
jgi:galactitol-specific phosphotransferase system IIC component